MGFYSRYVLPHVLHGSCSLEAVTQQRQKIVPLARGRVLEVGFGSGLNLPFYLPQQVEKLWALDTSEPLLEMAQRAASASAIDVEPLLADALAIPLADASVDTVVVTYSLCSINDVAGALGEMARVLCPDGRLLWCEHGLAPDLGVRRWQRRLSPIWMRFGGGCRLDRDTPALLTRAGFEISRCDSGYIPGFFKPARFNTWGVASALRA